MLWRISLCAVLAISLSAEAFAKKSDKIVVRAGTVAPEGTPWEQQIKGTKKHIRKDSGGRIKVKVYFGGAKGDEKSLVRQCRDARLEIIGVSTASIGTEVPEMQVLELPFIFKTSKEADFVLDKHLYKPIGDVMKKYGYILYQWAENGWQNIGLTDGFVKYPADLAGRKIRSQEAPVHLSTWKAMGASPTEMPVSEVLPALNTGRVDGFAQTPLYTFAAGWYRGIKYYTISRHLYQPGVLAYSKKFFDKVPADLQPALMGNVQKDTEKGRKGVRRLEPGLIKNFKNYGIKVYELTDKERKSFSKPAKAVRKEFESRATPEGLALLKTIDKAVKEYRSK
jgi:TRAP-type C4-dicarboxylate transport system substrate-binding protein